MIAINLQMWRNCRCYVWLPEGITKLALAYFHQKGNNIQTKNKITTTSEIITSRWVLIPAQPWRISALSSYVKLICLEIWLFFSSYGYGLVMLGDFEIWFDGAGPTDR